jgi:hypothetical protein
VSAPIDWKARREDLADAEKDIPFALVALQEQRLPKAVLNLAIALFRVTKHLTETEYRELIAGLEDLKARVAVQHDQAGPEPAEGDP